MEIVGKMNGVLERYTEHNEGKGIAAMWRCVRLLSVNYFCNLVPVLE
jgi:hypothetical protein